MDNDDEIRRKAGWREWWLIDYDDDNNHYNYDYDDDDSYDNYDYDDDDDSYDDYIKASFQLNNDDETSEGEEGCFKRMMMMMMIAMHDE